MGPEITPSFSLTGEGISREAPLHCNIDVGRKNRVKREVAKLEEDPPAESGVVDAVPDEERQEGCPTILHLVEQCMVEGARFGNEDHDQSAPLHRDAGLQGGSTQVQGRDTVSAAKVSSFGRTLIME